jgi:hypothetical protein
MIILPSRAMRKRLWIGVPPTPPHPTKNNVPPRDPIRLLYALPLYVVSAKIRFSVRPLDSDV